MPNGRSTGERYNLKIHGLFNYNIHQILSQKMVRREISPKALKAKGVEKATGDTVRETSEVPVIIITASPQDVADIQLEGLNIAGYIDKPFSLEDILKLLKQLLSTL